MFTLSKRMFVHLNQFASLFSKSVLLLITVSVFVPLSPKLPASGIDASWALALNQAVAQGLIFGKEIIFTLGPYSSIYTKAYHPATDFMMVAGSFYLAISYWIVLLLLIKNSRWYGYLIFCIPLFGMLYARDSLFFSYPLLVGLMCFKTVYQENDIPKSNTLLMLLTAFLFAPFGLYALIKGSMLILCFAITFFSILFFLVHRKIKLALVGLGALMTSLILFWLVAGQSLIYLPDYLINSFSIASGFSEAMSNAGDSNEVIFYLITVVLIFLFILYTKQAPKKAKIFLLCIYFIFLWVSFKTGFTRHVGHAFIPGTSILLGGLFLLFIFNSYVTYILLFISLTSWYCLNSHYTKISIRDNFKSSYFTAWHGLKNRIKDPYWPEKNFTFIMNFLREQAAFPVLQGTTDIYSYNQAYLISSLNNWLPRPIFQSYSVFTPKLAQINKKHLKEKGPDNIIFKIEPIDERVPFLEDGASWSLLLTRYHPTRINNDFLFLHKRKRIRDKKEILSRSENHTLGKPVILSQQKKIVFAKIEIRATIWGKLATLFFKTSPLQMTLHLKNGVTKHYRLIASMAKSGFLLSPLIENTAEFSLLYQKKEALYGKTVKSFIITSNQDKSWFWDNTYTLIFMGDSKE